MTQDLVQHQHGSFNLVPVKEGEVNGINMGVLSDGTPFLSSRGVARLVGQAPSSIITLVSKWEEERLNLEALKLPKYYENKALMIREFTLKSF